MDGPQPSPRRGRSRRQVLLGLLGTLVLGIGLSHLWFPQVVLLSARLAGVTVGGAEALDTRHLQLSGVVFAQEGLRLEIGRITLPQPLAWASGKCFRSPSATPPSPDLEITDWRLALDPSPDTAQTDPATPSTRALLDSLAPALHTLGWLNGPVLLLRGTILAGGRTWSVPQVTLAPEEVALGVGTEDWNATAALQRHPVGGFRLQAALAPRGTAFEGSLIPAEDGWDLSATVRDSARTLTLAARFAGESLLPESATLVGELPELALPDAFPGYVQPHVEADWSQGRGTIRIQAEGISHLAGPGIQQDAPLTASLAASFTTNRLEVSELRAQSSFLDLNLEGPVRLSLAERTVPPATLTFEARLDPLALDTWKGSVSGRLQTLETHGSVPGITFRLAGRELRLAGVEVEELSVGGRVDWPRARLDTLEVRLPKEAVLRGRGEADLLTSNLAGASITFQGLVPLDLSPSGQPLPPFSLDASASGPFTNLSSRVHLASLQPLAIPGFPPVNLDAQVEAQGMERMQAALVATNASTRLELATQVESRPDPTGRAWTARIQVLDWHEGTNVMLGLQGPFALAWHGQHPGPNTNAPGPIEFSVSQAHWRGALGEIQIAGRSRWPGSGEVSILCREVNPTRLGAEWPALPAWALGKLNNFEAALQWQDGPLDLRLDLTAEIPLPWQEVGTVQVFASGRAGAGGLQLAQLRLRREGVDALTARIDLPVRFRLSGEGLGWDAIPGGLLAGAAEIPAEAWVWSWVSNRTGFSTPDPSLRVAFGGTAEVPEIRLSSVLPAIRKRAETPEAPSLEVGRVELLAKAGPDEAVVETFRVQRGGQEIRATARLPLKRGTPDRFWADTRLADWVEAQADLVLPKTELAPLTEPWRELLQPTGSVQAEASLRQGRWQGWLEVTNVSVQPREPLGTLRDLALRVAVDGRTATVERGLAWLGGQPLVLSGWASLPPDGPWQANARVAATNLTLVRSTEAILRGDLDLSLLRTNTAAPPVLAGAVTLRNSVVMLDVQDLVRVNLDRPDQRPPYFSVSADAVKDWTLDVRVRGSRFARVVSPAFRGAVSADARLLGTLSQPRMLGEGVVDSGQILFPFGQLKVDQMRVRFTETDPYRPQLSGTAAGMNFGYSVSMRLEGSLDDPRLRFSTVPPMGTRAALQMLTAGTLPRGEYSFSGTARAQNVATYLAGDLVSNLIGDPSEESRLSFQSGQRVTAGGRLTYGVEYRLSDDWSLVGEYDRWGQFNAGVRWRILNR